MKKKSTILLFTCTLMGLASILLSGCSKDDAIPKIDPIITWENPADISIVTPLSATQLNATASVAGTFTYTPTIGTILKAGNNQTLKVDFTPTDIDAYNKTSKTVKINVSISTNVTVAGSLATLAASYLTTVTNLTVTGNIDARDFKTMRDKMPLLAVIDLSGTTIKAYSGTEGTENTYLNYLENEIPKYAFYNISTWVGKTSLVSFKYPISIVSIGENAFNNCDALSGSLIIPLSVKDIGNCAFYNCIGFNGTLTISPSVETIGSAAFYGCNGFTGSLVIPSSVKSIGMHAFNGCIGFKGTCTIGKSVTSIGDAAFNNCSGLTGPLTIPLSVTAIGSSAFSSCNGLTSFYASSTTPINISASPDVFYNLNTTTCTLHVPVGSKALYQAANQWKDFTNILDDIVTP